jgi:hypothetical protein
MNEEQKNKIKDLEKTILILEWDKSHGQLNTGKIALLEGYKTELAGIKNG